MIGVRDAASDRIVIDGLAFDNVTMGEAIDLVENYIDRGKEMLVVTTNVDNLLTLSRDEEFRRAYAAADLVLADGVPLLWLARLQGTPLKDRVSGADFVVEFCRMAAQRGRRVFFLGGLEGVAQRAAEVLQKRFPGLTVVGSHSPSWNFDRKEDENRQIVEMIKQQRPDILFIAAGAPKQENWLSRYRAEFGPVVSMGVGAAFDFVSGYKRRAPQVLRSCGLEWLWRLVHEPRRLFRRYILEDFPFFLNLLFKILARRLKGIDAHVAPTETSPRHKPDSRQGLP
jgi:N-acetylglucosaminyldiphosphoundecaprenol N-acetyl-beta-D-mannosaminyltransferase